MLLLFPRENTEIVESGDNTMCSMNELRHNSDAENATISFGFKEIVGKVALFVTAWSAQVCASDERILVAVH